MSLVFSVALQSRKVRKKIPHSHDISVFSLQKIDNACLCKCMADYESFILGSC